MEIIACVKQVPDVDEVQIDPKSNKLLREGVPSILNPFDKFVVEEAIRLKEKHKGMVTVLTMGPPKAADVLNTCFAMGVDKGYLLSDPALAGSDTLATALTLSSFIKKLQYDLVLCGLESTDSSTGQVGPELAEKLDIPQITCVSKIDLTPDTKKGLFTQETETGYRCIEGNLPLLITLVKGINIPREPDSTFVKGKRIEKISLKDIGIESNKVGINGSPTYVKKINRSKPHYRQNMMIRYNIPAHDRIKQIMRGGIADKLNSSKVEDSSDDILNRACDFILHTM